MRPTRIVFEGWVEHVDVHDHYVLSTLRTWKKRLASSHPDRLAQQVKEVPEVRAKQVDHCTCGRLKRRHNQRCLQCRLQAEVGSATFRETVAAYRRWVEEEREWYVRRGLTFPPCKLPLMGSSDRNQPRVIHQLEA